MEKKESILQNFLLFVFFLVKNSSARYKISSMFKHSRHGTSDCNTREKLCPLKLKADMVMPEGPINYQFLTLQISQAQP